MNERVIAYDLGPGELPAWFQKHQDGLTFRYADSPLRVLFDREIALPEDWLRHDRLLFFGPTREIRLRPRSDGRWHGLALGQVAESSGGPRPMAQTVLTPEAYEIETTFPDGQPLRYKLWGRRGAEGQPFREERIPGVGQYPLASPGTMAWIRACRYRSKASGLVEWIRFMDLEGSEHA